MPVQKIWRKINLLVFVLAFALFLIPFGTHAATEPTFGTAESLTNGGIQMFPAVSGNILAYVNGPIAGNIVIKDLDANKAATIPIPNSDVSPGCFIPSVGSGKVVFACDSGDGKTSRIYYVDTSKLSWDNPATPLELLPNMVGYSSTAPRIWSHYVVFDNYLGNNGYQILLYDLDSKDENPTVLDKFDLSEDAVGVLVDSFQDGVIAWSNGSSIKIYNLNDSTPQTQSFDVAGGIMAMSVDQDYVSWLSGSISNTKKIDIKSLAHLDEAPAQISSSNGLIGPKIIADRLIYFEINNDNASMNLKYYDLSSGQTYEASQNIDFSGLLANNEVVVFLEIFPPIAINESNIFWSNSHADYSGDIYSLSYVAGQSDDSVGDTSDEPEQPDISSDEIDYPEPAQKAHIDSWKAYQYENINGVICPNKLKLTIEGHYFDKDAEVRIGGHEASLVERKSSQKLVAKLCLDELLNNQTGDHKRKITVKNPHTKKADADKQIDLDNIPYQMVDDDFDSSTTEGVKNIQTALFNLELLEKQDITGIYGSITTAAVQKFQADNGLPQTGTLGPLTRAKLVEKVR